MNGPCTQKDEIQQIKDAMLSTDMVVFVTPIYYFGMQVQFETVIDRFYRYTMKLSAKRPKTALIALS